MRLRTNQIIGNGGNAYRRSLANCGPSHPALAIPLPCSARTISDIVLTESSRKDPRLLPRTCSRLIACRLTGWSCHSPARGALRDNASANLFMCPGMCVALREDPKPKVCAQPEGVLVTSYPPDDLC